MSKINPKLLDILAEEEVNALIEGIQDEDVTTQPETTAPDSTDEPEADETTTLPEEETEPDGEETTAEDIPEDE